MQKRMRMLTFFYALNKLNSLSIFLFKSFCLICLSIHTCINRYINI